MEPFDFTLRTRVVFGEGTLDELGLLGHELGFARALIVADKGIVATGLVDRAARLLDAVGIVPFFFHKFSANPDTDMVEAGREYAAEFRIDGIVALGGGSSLDCAKGINFVLTNGGDAGLPRHGSGEADAPSIGTHHGGHRQRRAVLAPSPTHGPRQNAVRR
jgi:alcohol dehydrogenase